MTTATRTFFFFAFTGAHGRTNYRRRGLVFTAREFRPIEIGTADNLDANPPIVGPETLAALKAETVAHPAPQVAGAASGNPTHTIPMLMSREATEEEVRRYLVEAKALKPRDRLEELEEENAKLRATAIDMEVRLLRLEATSSPATSKAATTATKGDRS